MTLGNLGNALQALGEREDSTARLEEAVAAYRAALTERPRERLPLEWAITQNNLGSALQSLGARESGTARLDEAVAAYRAALTERTRERVPLEWAITQYNLGNALRTLGARERGTTKLEEAVTAFDAALIELREECEPFHWARSTASLGLARLLIAERAGDIDIDIDMARTARSQIERALDAARNNGDARIVEFCAAVLPKADAMIERLVDDD